MFNAMEELMRRHPASHYGRPGHRPSDVDVFEELESRHLDSMRLERAAYLLVVGIDRLVGAIAALRWRIEELMRLHPASHCGRRGHRPFDVEVLEELESRHLRPRCEYEAGRRGPTPGIPALPSPLP